MPWDDCTQKVWYLPQANQSLSSVAIVSKTMRKPLKIFLECGKQNIAVPYHWATGNLKLHIQTVQTSEFVRNLLHLLFCLEISGPYFLVFGLNKGDLSYSAPTRENTNQKKLHVWTSFSHALNVFRKWYSSLVLPTSLMKV